MSYCFAYVQFHFSTSFGRKLNDLVAEQLAHERLLKQEAKNDLLIDLTDAPTSSANAIDMPPDHQLIPRQIWLLAERCRRTGFDQHGLCDTALCFSQADFATLRDYLDADRPTSEFREEKQFAD